MSFGLRGGAEFPESKVLPNSTKTVLVSFLTDGAPDDESHFKSEILELEYTRRKFSYVLM